VDLQGVVVDEFEVERSRTARVGSGSTLWESEPIFGVEVVDSKMTNAVRSSMGGISDSLILCDNIIDQIMSFLEASPEALDALGSKLIPGWAPGQPRYWFDPDPVRRRHAPRPIGSTPPPPEHLFRLICLKNDTDQDKMPSFADP